MQMIFHRYWIVAPILALLIFGCSGRAGRHLEEGFQHPPDYTKPWVYWYWIDENISKEGITRDLEAMQRVGIGQALIGHVSPGNRRGNVRVLTKEWWSMVEFAVSEGARLGVDIGFFNGPGWSQSGGPWISPELAMQYVSTNEIVVEGPARISTQIPATDTYFEDIAVLAFRQPEGEGIGVKDFGGRWKSMPSEKEPDYLFDKDLNTAFLLPEASRSDTFSVDVIFDQPIAVRSLTFHPTQTPLRLNAVLKASTGNGEFETVRQVDIDRRKTDLNIGPMQFAPLTISIPATSSRHFKLQFSGLWGNDRAGFREIELSPSSRVEMYAEKQLGKMFPDPLPGWNAYLWPQSTHNLSHGHLTNPQHILNIADSMDAEGNLHWTVPEGRWVIQRIFSRPTGMVNVPMPPEATGLECDKMSKEAVQVHFDHFIGKFLREVPAEQRKAFNRVVIDSYEVGPQNWTRGLEQIFQQRFGYDPIPWLPVLSGRVVGSQELSDRFLWDLRRLVADLIAENYMEGMHSSVNEHGLKLWVENYGHWGFPAEFLQYGSYADEVSGEFWYLNPYWNLGRLELRGASSVTNTYGKSFTSAEAFTAGFNFRQHPGSMKSRGDWAYCQGINHFVLHLYIHQPWEDRVPGVNAWFGMSFQRHNTWFEQSKAWIAYMRRCQYLLRQGKHVADICFFTGEDTPKMTGATDPGLPRGYDFDFINAEVIERDLIVEDGWLTLPDGMRYRLLVLPPLETMRPEVLRKIGALVQQGAHVHGPPPVRSPSMTDYPHCDEEVRSLANEIWGSMHGEQEWENQYGKGFIYYGSGLERVLRRINTPPDVVCSDTAILWTHRRSAEGDVYFVSNQEHREKAVDIAFRINDRQPELWNPLIGDMEQSAIFESKEGYVRVPMHLDPSGSVFVVFRKEIPNKHAIDVTRLESDDGIAVDADSPKLIYGDDGAIMLKTRTPGDYRVGFSDGSKVDIEVEHFPESVQLQGSWEVHFPAGWGVPERLVFNRLLSFTDYSREDIRHFSGTATYTKSFNVQEIWLKEDHRIMLDLGRVGMIAEIKVNDTDLGILWSEPYALDITKALNPGENILEVKVTNVWWNRLVGDQKYPADTSGTIDPTTNGQKRTFTTHKAWSADEPLLTSGLMGPVTLSIEKGIPVLSK